MKIKIFLAGENAVNIKRDITSTYRFFIVGTSSVYTYANIKDVYRDIFIIDVEERMDDGRTRFLANRLLKAYNLVPHTVEQKRNRNKDAICLRMVLEGETK